MIGALRGGASGFPKMKRLIYLDHQAATPVLPEALDAMLPFFRADFGNASSLHHYGVNARDALARAREQFALFLNAELPEEIIFTSGGTEAVNLAIKGCALANERHGKHLVVSAIEHPAVLNSVAALARHGFTHTRVKVDANGFVNPADVSAAVTDETILIAVHHVNHDLGTLEPIAEIGAIAADCGVPLFVDAVASAGWVPVDVQALGASLLALSPQRFYGPKGVGVLYRNQRARLVGIQDGGRQEDGRRAGTENVPAIVGAGVAAAAARRELLERAAHLSELQGRLWEQIRARIPFVRLNGPEPGPRRSPANLNVSFEFLEGEGLALLLDTLGVAVASGTSCVSRAEKVPPVLAAIGLDPSLAQGTILLSLGRDNTAADVDDAVVLLEKAVSRLREMSPSWDEFQRGLVDSVIHPRAGGAGAAGAAA